MKIDIRNLIAYGCIGVVIGTVIKKLDDIHDEIKYFERQKGIYLDRKEYHKQFK